MSSLARPQHKQRTVSTSSRRRATRRTVNRRRRRLATVIVMALVGFFGLALLDAQGLVDLPAGAPETGTHTIQYVAVTGDTAASVASAFAQNPWVIVRQSGVAAAESPLPAGTRLSIDTSLLWARIHGAELASTESMVEAAARRLGVEPALAVAVAWQESRLDQSARSTTGAIGIMQVEPDTSALASRDLGVSIDATRASDNVLAGIFWLHSLLSSYGGDRSSALAAYYEGPGNLARQGYLPGTSTYVAHATALTDALLAAAPGLRS